MITEVCLEIAITSERNVGWCSFVCCLFILAFIYIGKLYKMIAASCLSIFAVNIKKEQNFHLENTQNCG